MNADVRYALELLSYDYVDSPHFEIDEYDTDYSRAATEYFVNRLLSFANYSDVNDIPPFKLKYSSDGRDCDRVEFPFYHYRECLWHIARDLELKYPGDEAHDITSYLWREYWATEPLNIKINKRAQKYNDYETIREV